MIRLLFAALFATLLVACKGTISSPSYTLIDSKRVISQAETAIAKVAKVGYTWRDTGAMLADAKAAQKKGDHNTAVALAGKAERQAQHAYDQYKMEMKAHNY